MNDDRQSQQRDFNQWEDALDNDTRAAWFAFEMVLAYGVSESQGEEPFQSYEIIHPLYDQEEE